MNNRAFTRREKILLVILAVLIVVVGYTRLFLQPMQDKIDAENTRQAEAEEQTILETTKLMKMKQMEEDLAAMKAAGAVPNAEVPAYDNIENVMIQLNTILRQATDYSLAFKEVSIDQNGMVSRPIEMSFTAGNYATVRSIVNDLYHCWYRCAIDSISVSAMENLSNNNIIQVELSVIFYEKVNG